ncbi:MAG: hypothetical protein HGA98_00815 [Deltaproteobacteria bacterium]|nr:hypothetical protein [Deltaproteobacteria bacterium]
MSRARPLSRILGALCAAGLAAAGAGGCGFSKDLYSTPGFSTPGTSYGEALAAHTRKAELYEGFDTVAKGWVTWQGPELRRALVEANIRAYGLEGAAAEAKRRDEERAGIETLEFHLALYTPKKQWNDLEAGDSLWRLRVDLGDGREVAPSKVTVVPKTDKSPVQYPYVTPWTREYAVVFPKPEGAGTERPVLVLAGPLGRMKFAF